MTIQGFWLRSTVALACLFALSSACAGNEPVGMDPYTKDFIDALAKLVGLLTVGGGLCALWLQLRRWRDDRTKALDEQTRATELRREELRWRKASLARDALDDLFDDKLAADAMRMLDWSGREYKVNDQQISINTATMLASLRIENLQFKPEETFVRDCFDAFFGHMEMIQHFLDVHLLEFEDVQYPFSYYAPLMAKHRKVFRTFLVTYNYNLARQFLEHFDGWGADQREI
jgi:hypothetical protein